MSVRILQIPLYNFQNHPQCSTFTLFFHQHPSASQPLEQKPSVVRCSRTAAMRVASAWPRYTPWRRFGWEELQLLLFLNLVTRRGWVVSVKVLPCFTPGERAPGAHCIAGYLGPTADLEAEVRGGILCIRRGSNSGLPVRSQTLYWLSSCCKYVASRIRRHSRKQTAIETFLILAATSQLRKVVTGEAGTAIRKVKLG
jgi:hypothetical protein